MNGTTRKIECCDYKMGDRRNMNGIIQPLLVTGRECRTGNPILNFQKINPYTCIGS